MPITDEQTQIQNEVFAFLADPATHEGQPVRRIDTHAAAVFLAGPRALKVKRAVRYPFLDYSTLERRRNACLAEIEVNKPYTAELYRGVVPISREPDGSLAIGGFGRVLEWAVDMRRFDETATLDGLADRGALTEQMIDRLAAMIAAAHSRSPPTSAEMFVKSLAHYLAQNDTELRERPELFEPGEISALTGASQQALERLRPLLLARGAEGRVRRGHGDLHLGNVAMIEGRPVPFDALEFDPNMASGDVLYDLAFLLMDLIERGLAAHANIALNRYLAQSQHTGDLDALKALPLFLSLRAAIRAKVTAARLATAIAERRADIIASARTYFALTRTLIAASAPVFVAVGGLSGTGKSLVARGLAPDLAPPPGAVVLRSDVERKALFGVAETDSLPPQAYAADVTERVYATLRDKAGRVAAAGHSAIVDAVFARSEERSAIEEVGHAHGVRFFGLFLTADLATRVSRVSHRQGDASDADAAVAVAQERYDLSGLSWRQIDAGGTPEATLSLARGAIEEAKASQS